MSSAEGIRSGSRSLSMVVKWIMLLKCTRRCAETNLFQLRSCPARAVGTRREGQRFAGPLIAA